jgi:hypothetical protein
MSANSQAEMRPCICGKINHLEKTWSHTVTCLCGGLLHVFPSDPESLSWHLQHGDSPEHRSPDYQGNNLIAACDWVDAVHDHAAEEGVTA